MPHNTTISPDSLFLSVLSPAYSLDTPSMATQYSMSTQPVLLYNFFCFHVGLLQIRVKLLHRQHFFLIPQRKHFAHILNKWLCVCHWKESSTAASKIVTHSPFQITCRYDSWVKVCGEGRWVVTYVHCLKSNCKYVHIHMHMCEEAWKRPPHAITHHGKLSENEIWQLQIGVLCAVWVYVC